MIIVDNLAQNFKLQKDNGILIKSFDKNTDPKKDFILSDLAIILNDIAKLHLKDIRKALISYKSQIASKITEI